MHEKRASPDVVAAQFKMLRVRHDFPKNRNKAVLAKLPLMLSCRIQSWATVKRKAKKSR